MQLTLTQTEAKNLIASALKGIDVVASDVNILPADEVRVGMNYVEAITRITHIDYPKTYQSSQKIAAIKKLREYIPGLGLGDAKVAIERPEEAIMFYLRNGTVLQYSY